MTDENEPCVLSQQANETIVVLTADVGIYQSEQLKQLLLQAIDFNKALRIDMSNLNELDLTTMQLLFYSCRS